LLEAFAYHSEQRKFAMREITRYAGALLNKARKTFDSGEFFAKVLSPNDDSGRHGVLIPTVAYSFFPDLLISDPTVNETGAFDSFDSISGASVTLGYKYYQRYPERRITRLPAAVNDKSHGRRLLVILRATDSDGESGYYIDCANAAPDGRFGELFQLLFGDAIEPADGRFIIRPVESDLFSVDADLAELLGRFDGVKERGWISSLREGDTGIGYTFETLCGITENNDQLADFRGIEIKCQGIKEGQIRANGKVNLFQSGPVWSSVLRARDRIRQLGKPGETGLYSCYSQVTTAANNLNLLLEVADEQERINLRKNLNILGYWPFESLESRLLEKHSRAVFIKANVRRTGGGTKYKFEELVYCDRPSIVRFVKLVSLRNIVFEFTMSEKPDGRVRNHGYPWRLTRSELLDHLFTFQIQLRARSLPA
jgi:hypothetical protein